MREGVPEAPARAVYAATPPAAKAESAEKSGQIVDRCNVFASTEPLNRRS
jgi:hypothetical protein